MYKSRLRYFTISGRKRPFAFNERDGLFTVFIRNPENLNKELLAYRCFLYGHRLRRDKVDFGLRDMKGWFSENLSLNAKVHSMAEKLVRVRRPYIRD